MEIIFIDSSVLVVILIIVKIVSWFLLFFNEGVFFIFFVLFLIYGVDLILFIVEYKIVL